LASQSILQTTRSIVIVGEAKIASFAPYASTNYNVQVVADPTQLDRIRAADPDAIILFHTHLLKFFNSTSADDYAKELRLRGIAKRAALIGVFPENEAHGQRWQPKSLTCRVSSSELREGFADVVERAISATQIPEQMSILAKESEPELFLTTPTGTASTMMSLSTRSPLTPDASQFKDRSTSTHSHQTCPHCKRWVPFREDTFCGWCAAPLVIPQYDPHELHFSSAPAETEAALHLRNDGVNALHATVVLAEGAETRFKIVPERRHGLFSIPAGASETITVSFDASGIEATTDYSSELEIDTNLGGETVRVPLRVERPPVARILPPSRQTLVYGDDLHVDIAVRNLGGGILRTSRIKLTEPREFVANVPIDSELPSASDVMIPVPIPFEKVKAGRHLLRGSIEFHNHSEQRFVVEFDFERPPRIRLGTPEVHADLHNIGRRCRSSIALRNIGSETLRISKTDGDVDWMSTICKIRDVVADSEAFIDILIDGTGLSYGTHTGTVCVESNSHDGRLRIPVVATVSELPMLSDPIGVDFGTSLSCVATVRNGDPVLVDINPQDTSDSVEGHGLPSLVFFEENFFPIVGSEAKGLADRNPAAAVRSVKRLLGSQRKLRVRDREIHPRAVCTEILRALLGAVESSTDPKASPMNALLTVPADISDEHIADALAAASDAGLAIDNADSNEFLLDEPSAAALYYLWKSRRSPRSLVTELVFIYDFGAGTLDCSLVGINRQNESTTIRVLATTGDRRLGGDDLDWELARHLARELAKIAEFDPGPVLASDAQLNALGADKGAYLRALELRNQFCRTAERVKIDLSTASVAKAKLTIGGRSHEVAVTRDQFENLLDPYLKRSDAVVTGCCNIARIKPQHVHTVLHTGRGSAVPRMRSRIKQAFPSAEDRSEFVEAKQCVAMGAAWWAYIKNVPGINVHFEGVGALLPHTICYRSVSGVEVKYVNIFEAGQSYPAEKSVTLPWHAGRRFQLDIVEKRFGVDDLLRPRGSVVLPALDGDRAYECMFKLTANRVLEVDIAGQRLRINPYEEDDRPSL
jgi:molecular chaperone DnaK (HSP70)